MVFVPRLKDGPYLPIVRCLWVFGVTYAGLNNHVQAIWTGNSWASALHRTYQLNSNQSLPSLYQLGDWLLPNVSTWQFQQSTMRLFHQRPDSSWSQHSILVSSRQLRILKFHFHGLDSLPPADTVNCTVILKSPHCIFMTGFAPSVPTTPPPPPSSSFLESLKTLPKSAQWALHSVNQECSLTTLRQSLCLGSAIAVSDGSFLPPLSTASWIFSNEVDSLSGLCCVPGHKDYQDAYRGELGGLYGIVLIVWALEQFFPEDRYILSIYCDGKEAGVKAGRPLDQAWGLFPQHNLLSAIWSLWSNLRSQLTFLHVDGHLDDHYDIDSLPLQSKLNVRMDFQAKEF